MYVTRTVSRAKLEEDLLQDLFFHWQMLLLVLRFD
jgi:hypothetical protein